MVKPYIKSFTEYTEAINVSSNQLILNADDGISSAFGQGKYKPYRKKIEADFYSYSLYSANHKSDISKAIKTAKIDDEMDKFLTRSAIYAVKLLRDIKADVIVSPQSSSPLARLFTKKIKERTNHEFFIDSFSKTVDLNKVTIDHNHPLITDGLIKSLEKTLARGRKKGFIKIKDFQVRDRKFIRNLFEIVDSKIETKVQGKNVVIIDDVTTSGSTGQQIYNILKTHGAENITVLTLFKS